MKSRLDQSEAETECSHCWGTNSQIPMLRVELRDGSFHLFPYGLLLSAQFSPAKEKDSLTLAFDAYSVRIVGTRLKKLGLALQQLSVEWIRETTGNAALTDSATAARIERIHVTQEKSANPAEE